MLADSDAVCEAAAHRGRVAAITGAQSPEMLANAIEQIAGNSRQQ